MGKMVAKPFDRETHASNDQTNRRFMFLKNEISPRGTLPCSGRIYMFFLETALPIKVKFYVELSWEEGDIHL